MQYADRKEFCYSNYVWTGIV